MEAEVKACRLQTGEYLIGEVVFEQTTGLGTYHIANPMLFEVQKTNDVQGYRVGFMSLIPMQKPGDKVKIDPKDVLFWIETPDPLIVESFQSVQNPVDDIN